MWIMMFFFDLLIPATMIGFGGYFIGRAPREINHIFGYRTPRSMQNRDTWDFAHKYIGKLWRIVGVILLPMTVAAMLFLLDADENTVGTVGGIVCFIQLVPMTLTIVPTEAALKRTFDENGERRKMKG